MNNTNSQVEPMAAKCCVDYCEQNIEAQGRQIVNYYACGKKISAAEVWNIQKNRKMFTRRPDISQ